MHPKNVAHEPPTGWGELVSVYDERDAIQSPFDEAPVIDEPGAQPLRRRFQAA
jgi:hypothetical protein